jgi:hypothetical protein
LHLGFSLGDLAKAPAPLGTFDRVQEEVNKIVSSGAAARWGVAGSLTSAEVKIEHPGPETANRFRRSALKDLPKSNVFALDIAWRSGFHVPLLDVGTGGQQEFIYPLANMLTSFAEGAIGAGPPFNVLLDGTDICGKNVTWGSASTPLDIAEIHNKISGKHTKGSQMFLLVGWRPTGTGHVGIISRIRWIKYRVAQATSVGILEIEYDGWEAQTDRARRVTKSHWSTAKCERTVDKCPAPLKRQSLENFCAIQIIGLRPQLILCNRGVEVQKTDVCKLS